MRKFKSATFQFSLNSVFCKDIPLIGNLWAPMQSYSLKFFHLRYWVVPLIPIYLYLIYLSSYLYLYSLCSIHKWPKNKSFIAILNNYRTGFDKNCKNCKIVHFGVHPHRLAREDVKLLYLSLLCAQALNTAGGLATSVGFVRKARYTLTPAST